MTIAVSHVFTAKYTATMMATYRTTVGAGAGPPKSGSVPLSAKKIVPAAHVDRPRLAKLKSVCVGVMPQRTEMRTPSRASVTTPTAGPKIRTEAKANASDTEKRVSIDGIL